jgi:hypothetical protein
MTNKFYSKLEQALSPEKVDELAKLFSGMIKLPTPTILIDDQDVTGPYFTNFIWSNFNPGETVWLEDNHDVIPVSAVFMSYANGTVNLVTNEESYQ